RRPSTVTRPAAISSSQARRDPTPAAARIFCSRMLASALAALAPSPGCVRSSLGKIELIDVVRQERRDRRQVGHAVDAKLLEEEAGGAVQVRAALGLGAAFLDEPPRNQRLDDAVAVDPANGRYS